MGGGGVLVTSKKVCEEGQKEEGKGGWLKKKEVIGKVMMRGGTWKGHNMRRGGSCQFQENPLLLQSHRR